MTRNRAVAIRWIAMLTILFGVISCSFIEFERGSYAIRGLEVVYSEQEELTFLVWRLRPDADLERVRFELFDDGWQPVHLQDAVFAAEPYRCGDFTCFQFQIEGRMEWQQVDSPVRSIHDEFGTFHGPTPSVREASSTFRARPFPVGKNDRIDPVIWSWFEDLGVPLRRSYEWRFVDRDGESCLTPTEDKWNLIDGFAETDTSWTNEEVCFAIRPARPGGPSDVTPVIPAAVTTWHRYRYTPPRLRQPIYYSVLLDLEIPNAGRCTQVKDYILNAIDDSINARGTQVRLGVYTPISRDTGESLGGCEQERRQLYPVADILRDADDAVRDAAPEPIKIVWIYVNNLDLPPPADSAAQLGQLIPREEEERRYESITWAIGSSTILTGLRSGEATVSWDLTTGWRPIEDETFRTDIRATAAREMPFFTMQHDADTLVEVIAPPGTEPEFFKICGSTPEPIGSFGIWSSGFPIDFPYPQAVAQRWANDGGPPYFKLDLEPQVLVTRAEYLPVEIDVIVEVCEAFCNHPFRTRGGEIYPDWREPVPGGYNQEVCQWSE